MLLQTTALKTPLKSRGTYCTTKIQNCDCFQVAPDPAFQQQNKSAITFPH